MGQLAQPKAWGSLALALLVSLLAMPGPSLALPPVRKTPSGDFVTELGGVYSVPRGQQIDWTISLCNDTPGPLIGRIFDQVHGGDCGPEHQYLSLACPPVIEPASAGGSVVVCDDSLIDSLDVVDLSVAVATCVDLRFRTRVELLTPPGVSQVCNIGFFTTDVGESGQSTPPGAASPGCSCVELLPALPTQLDLRLEARPDVTPFVGGETTSTAVWEVLGDNLTPRDAEGELRVPLPAGLRISEILSCPPGANCSVGGLGEFLIEDLVIAEGGSFSASFRVQGGCLTYGVPEACAQALFSPLEDPSAIISSDADPVAPGAQATCMPIGSEDLSLSVKTWELIDDADGDGVASRDDRVRFRIQIWNRGLGPARDVVVTDAIPLGFDRASVVVDPSGSYDGATATWSLPSLGPGSVAELWLEVTMTSNNPCNKARFVSAARLACIGGDLSTDDPFTLTAGDSTCPNGPGNAAPALSKTFTFSDADGDGRVSDGEFVTLRLEVTNHGALTATNVVLSDTLAACWGDINLASVRVEPPASGTDLSTARELRIEGLGGPSGLAPQETVVVTFEAPAANASSCCNQAMLSWDGGAAVLPSDDPRTIGGPPDATCLALVSAPRPRLSKRVVLLDRDGDGMPSTRDRLQYTITLVNEGTAALDGLLLSDDLPAGVWVDEATISSLPAQAFPWRLVPAPGGAFGSGRIEVTNLSVAPGATARLVFEVVLLGGGLTCNRAGLAAPGLVLPLLSEDATSGGASCVSVVLVPVPTLGVSLAASGPLRVGCAQPGEEISYQLGWEVTGAAGTTTTRLTLFHSAELLAIDSDGASEVLPGEMNWDLGAQAVGSSGTRRPVFQSRCNMAAGTALESRARLSSPEAALDASETGPTILSGRSEFSGLVVLDHDDADADLLLGPGETVALTVTLSEIGGCENGDLRVFVDLPPELAAAAVRDGGIELGGRLIWEAPATAALSFVAPGGFVVLRADLQLAPGPADCLGPAITTTIEWPASAGSDCPTPDRWIEADRSLPETECIAAGVVDLLREDAVTALGPSGPAPALATLLDASGNWNGCDGELPRIDPGRLLLPDVEIALGSGGVVAPGDALPVGSGSPGVLIFYEATATCRILKACKSDDDGLPANGRESVLLTTGADCEP